jgi:cytochrome b561
MNEVSSASEPGYGSVAKGLHWLIAILIVAQFAVAWTMPGIHRGTRPEMLINLHFSLGVTILVAVILRLAWRLLHPVPLVSNGVPIWQNTIARITHALLYLVLLALPIMGWANASARGWTINFFGLVELPRILPTASPLGRQLGNIHVLTSYALLGLVGLHLLGALYHQFWLRDRTLWRILPSPN